MATDLSLKIIKAIKSIPKGKVASYGQIARLAGNPRAARQVSWVLHSCSKKEKLPWHRVVNSKGRISLPLENGYFRQKRLLQKESVAFDHYDNIDLSKFQFQSKNKN